jgi:hypothetical protein
MRIAFDLDGVLADLHRAFVRVAIELFPETDSAAVAEPDLGASPPDEEPSEAPAAPETIGPVPALSRRQVGAVWDRLGKIAEFWETLDEIEAGAIARLAEVASARRWEVIFLTSRPYAPGKTVQRQSQAWLAGRGFPMPSVFVVYGSRGKIADALHLDVVVDDRPQNCLDVVLESKARAILIWRGSPATVPASAKRLGIGVVSTVAACLDTLIEADRDASGTEDLMSRLRRLLGLTTKVPVR